MNIEELKKDYIITRSVDCTAYLLMFCGKDKVELFANEDGYNLFGIKKSSDLLQIYFNYKNCIKNSIALGIDDLIMYNNNIRYLKKLCRSKRSEQGNKEIVINIDGEEFMKAVNKAINEGIE